MNLLNNITLNLYSIILLLIIYLYSTKHQDNVSASSRLYFKVIRVTILLLLIDCFSRFDGHPDTIYPLINYTGNFLVFILSPILPSLWVLYVHFQLFNDENKTNRLILPLVVINIIHAVFVVLNLTYGWFYVIGPENIYLRGPGFILSAMVTILLLIFATFMVLLNRRRVYDKHYFSLLFFIIPPALSIVLQICLYGSSLVLNSVVFSILIVFLNIQNKSIYTDHLTGVYNRNMLDKYLKNKIEKSTKTKSFSAIMMDLNDFKCINDTFGHDMGDKALQNTVRILKSSIKSSDFVARFGGDEFCIILNTSTESELAEIVDKINTNLFKYNQLDTKTYELGLSMGYAIYKPDKQMTVSEFQIYLDELMYINKGKHAKDRLL